MKKLLVWTVLAVIGCFHLVGCTEEQASKAADPNSTFNQTGDQVADKADEVAIILGLLGPWGETAAGLVTLAGFSWGAWQKSRRKLEGIEAVGTLGKVTKVTSATVIAIEDLKDVKINSNGVETTLGELVKDRIKARLEDKDIYEQGKALITAIKNGLDDVRS